MTASQHAERHLLALPSWLREQLEQQVSDTTYVHAHDFTMRWREKQARDHQSKLEGK